ncbi:MAG: hypothetical protein KF859_08715 [Phycisphaeraceae bacterium]|nr:hypothetical protein [Phycisphaeraceae bacterium]
MPVATFPCTSCGAELEFAPGTTSLTCKHCGGANDIPAPVDDDKSHLEELDFLRTLEELAEKGEQDDRIVVHCDSCGADVKMPDRVTSKACCFCGSNIVATGRSQRLIRPRGLLPFHIDRDMARDLFARWLAGRWFAPSDLARHAMVEGDEALRHGSGITGVYVPYWTFDCDATTSYTGQRGDDYYVTVPVVTTVNGKRVTRMQRQRRTRWRWVSGVVHNSFDDILVRASTTLPADHLESIGRWDLANLAPYRDEFLSGFHAESYSVDLPAGFVAAKQASQSAIRASIQAQIGGDHQRIASMNPVYSDVTFKHILLPVWVSAYRYHGTIYRFLVNGRNGSVCGQRPYSWRKITGLVLVALAAIALIALVISMS